LFASPPNSPCSYFPCASQRHTRIGAKIHIVPPIALICAAFIVS
jgi:hypothetical protein